MYAFLCALTTFLLSKLWTPVYRANAALEIQGLNENYMNMTAVDPVARAGISLTDTYIQTQIEILGSNALVAAAVTRLKLHERPEFAPKPKTLAAWRPSFRFLSTRPTTPLEYATAVAKDNLTIAAKHGTRIVRIQYDSTDPKVAADFANTLAQLYIRQSLDLRLGSTQHTGEWLVRQIEVQKEYLEKSETQIQDYARASGLLFTAEKDNLTEERLKQLQDELSKAQSTRITKQSSYELLAQGPADSLPETQEDAALRDYQVKLTQLGQQLADLRSLLTPNHYRVKQVQAQVTELEKVLEKERSKILKRINNDYELARRREQLLTGAYERQAILVHEQSEKLVRYRLLKREVDTNRQLYEVLLQKVKEAAIASAMLATNIAVVDPAEPPSRPYKPQPLLNGTLGLLSGVLFGTLASFIRERGDRSLRAPGDSLLYLKLPELGVIPSANAAPSLRRILRAKLLSGELTGKRVQPTKAAITNVELATWRDAPPLLADSFRAVLASILFAGENGARPRVIVLTSPGPREGKTTAVTNLGIALARIKHRVLLIDGDMRRPRLHRIFSLPNGRGLSDLLEEGKLSPDGSVDAMVLSTEVPYLSVLTSGSPNTSPSDLLHSPRLPEWISRFRQEFDTVLIDTPPVLLQLADTRVLGRLADAVVLVCRAGETNRDSALAAIHRLAADGTPVLGAILNDCNPTTTSYYQYHYSGDPAAGWLR